MHYVDPCRWLFAFAGGDPEPEVAPSPSWEWERGGTVEMNTVGLSGGVVAKAEASSAVEARSRACGLGPQRWYFANSPVGGGCEVTTVISLPAAIGFMVEGA